MRFGMRGAARRQIDEAIATYGQFMEVFGNDTPWVDITELEEFHDEDFPPWAGFTHQSVI